MTKPFRVRYTCENCGHQTSAETAFGRWMRHHPKLQPGSDHITRTDTDHFILKFMTNYHGKKFQLIMLVETKEWGSEPDETQGDIMYFIDQMCRQEVKKNMHGAECYPTRKLKSLYNCNKLVAVRYMGYHLLQFEKKSPVDSTRIWWDHKEISVKTLVRILALDLYPDPPYKPMDEYLRDRHKEYRRKQAKLFVEEILVDDIKPPF